MVNGKLGAEHLMYTCQHRVKLFKILNLAKKKAPIEFFNKWSKQHLFFPAAPIKLFLREKDLVNVF